MRHNIQTTRQAVQVSLPFIKGRVLDAGGGPSTKYRSLIQSKADKYICLDSQAGDYVDVVGDVLKMPFQDESFDTVVCTQVLEHVPYPIRLIKEVYRVLNSGGYFICTAPFLEPNHADPGDYFRYTIQGLESLCTDVGFRIIKSQAYGGLFLISFSFIKFHWFDPYKKQSRFKRRLLEGLFGIFLKLDRYIVPRRIYADVLVVAQKN